MRNEKLNNEFVVEGEQCDLIIDRKSGSKRELFVVSKTSDGWKINAGIGLGMSEIKSFDTVVIDLYQYKNTGEYFISIIDMNGGELEISDKNNAKFYSVRDYDVFLEEAYYTYYANVPKLDSDYYIVINGNEIKLQD